MTAIKTSSITRAALGMALGATALFTSAIASAAPISILFVGNSYTFGRVDPVMSYNAANVRDLTAPSNGGNFTNTTGSNPYEPHPWGGVPGIFKMFTTESGQNYDVAISARNAASLRGQLLNSNPASWDLRGNIGSQSWDKVVLQELSDGALPLNTTSNASPGYFSAYAKLIANFVHNQSSTLNYTETSLFGSAANCRNATGASTTSCNTARSIPGNTNTNPNAQVFLYETWARPDLVTGAVTSTTDPTTGAITRTTTPGPGAYTSLQGMTDDLHAAYFNLASANPSIFAGVAPVGDAFQSAVNQELATSNPYASDALTDGKLDLWWDDELHASKWGSYLSALTLYGTITGLNPTALGPSEQAAQDLGISSGDAHTLQLIAAQQLGFSDVPEPSSGLVLAMALGTLAWCTRRGRSQA